MFINNSPMGQNEVLVHGGLLDGLTDALAAATTDLGSALISTAESIVDTASTALIQEAVSVLPAPVDLGIDESLGAIGPYSFDDPVSAPAPVYVAPTPVYVAPTPVVTDPDTRVYYDPADIILIEDEDVGEIEPDIMSEILPLLMFLFV